MTTLSQLNPLADICAAVRQIHPDMTVSQLQVFLLLVVNPRMTMHEVSERTGLMEGSVSRIVALLAQHGSRSTAALNLFRMDQDDNDRRLRVLTLTPKGKQAVAQLSSLMSYGVAQHDSAA